FQKQSRLLSFDLMRVQGADVYGSFLIGIEVLNAENQLIKQWDMGALSTFPLTQINNHYVAKIKPGVHSLILPLGAKATMELPLNTTEIPKKIRLTDISGMQWESIVDK
ncbi:MAG TPA: TQO small subunit DoxA domain-containing protein, partial [Flavobacterium sp.]|nr:TQO small subunit DoxA domain-containing protein [Flavobacterium sp.]